MSYRYALGALALASACGMSFAGVLRGTESGSIADGTDSYAFAGVTGNAGAGVGDWNVNGADQLFQSWWYYRADVETDETPFGNGLGSSQAFIGDTATLMGEQANGVMWSIRWIVDGSARTLTSVLSVTNVTTAPITLDLFNYADLDAGGNSAQNSASLDGEDVIAVSSPEGVTVTYEGSNADAYQVDDFAALRQRFNDGFATDLDNSGLDFDGDFTGAFQWSRVLQPKQTTDVRVVFTIPGPGSMALLGIAGLVALRRKR